MVDLTTTVRPEHRLYLEWHGINASYELRKLVSKLIRERDDDPEQLQVLVEQAQQQGFALETLRNELSSISDLRTLVEGPTTPSSEASPSGGSSTGDDVNDVGGEGNGLSDRDLPAEFENAPSFNTGTDDSDDDHSTDSSSDSEHRS